MKLLIKMSYDGQNFNGWQCQQSGRTVQDVLEESLKRLTGIEIKVCGSGRTDSGVHALAQYAHFEFPFDINPDKLVLVLNAKLPPDLKIISADLVKPDFHARYSACSRTYKYLLTNERTPFNRSYKSFIPKLNYSLEQILHYLPIFIGEHDFTLFSKVNPDLTNRL
ncbi:MAG: tRNA pseudouridine(38-40) synthase TruA, partial [Candidatus Cloacimonetes bacterium]|nr:tRNA pseudouridine(38-40) synthase TruA [Candidatus Cloacimonadota bacterium]